MKTIATAKRATKIDEAIQRMDPKTYVEILLKEPLTKLTRTRNGYVFKMVTISKTAANQIKPHISKFKNFGDVEIVDGNFVFSIDIYNIDRFDLRNFLSLVDRIKDRIRMN